MGDIDGSAALFLAAGLATSGGGLASQGPRAGAHFDADGVSRRGCCHVRRPPDLPDPDPLAYPEVALQLTEVCVIVSLMGAGLAINRPFTLRGWSSTWRLLGITMPLSMIAVGLIGWSALGLGAASAILLAAALRARPTRCWRPRCKSSEPVTERGSDDDEVRFSLTSEAGLNDGLAFPFTWAAVAAASPSQARPRGLGSGFSSTSHGGWRLGVSPDTPWDGGWPACSSRVCQSASTSPPNPRASWPLLRLSWHTVPRKFAHGYGFLAVFVCACTMRNGERQHRYHEVLHTFVEQIERLLTVVVIVLLGGAVSRGLLAGIGWKEIAFAAAFLLDRAARRRSHRSHPREDRPA